MGDPDFKQFFLGMKEAERKRFAKDAKTTVGYLMAHVIHARKRPMEDSFDRLVKACAKHGGPSEEQLLKFFYSPRSKQARVA